GGERVVGDLGAASRHRCDQRRRARAGKTHQSDVGDGFHLQPYVQYLALFALERKTGGLAFLGGQGRVTQPPVSSSGQNLASSVTDQVGDDLAVHVGDHGAIGIVENQVFAVCTSTVTTLTGGAVSCGAVGAAPVVQQRGALSVDLQDHVTTTATVGTVGAAERLEFLPVRGNTAVSAVPCPDMQSHFVDEVRHGSPRGSWAA